jgi:uncharacterized protein YbjT (DUF2867 family)
MYAVAGVTGRTGAAVAGALLEAKQKVRAIVRGAEAGATWNARGAQVAIADLADPVSLTAALRGTQGAYLLCPPRYDLTDPFTNAEQIGASMAQAIEASGVPRAVVLSSAGGHRAAGTGIIGTLHRVEEALAKVETPTAIVRASYFFENWGAVIGAVRGEGILPTFFKTADYAVPTQSVRDIAATVVALLTGATWQGRKVIELSSFSVSAADVANAFAEILGKPIAPIVLPHDQWLGILRGSSFSPEVAQQFVAMYDGLNSGVVAAEPGNEARQGRTTLTQAARSLLGDER